MSGPTLDQPADGAADELAAARAAGEIVQFARELRFFVTGGRDAEIAGDKVPGELISAPAGPDRESARAPLEQIGNLLASLAPDDLKATRTLHGVIRALLRVKPRGRIVFIDRHTEAMTGDLGREAETAGPDLDQRAREAVEPSTTTSAPGEIAQLARRLTEAAKVYDLTAAQNHHDKIAPLLALLAPDDSRVARDLHEVIGLLIPACSEQIVLLPKRDEEP